MAGRIALILTLRFGSLSEVIAQAVFNSLCFVLQKINMIFFFPLMHILVLRRAMFLGVILIPHFIGNLYTLHTLPQQSVRAGERTEGLAMQSCRALNKVFSLGTAWASRPL